MFVICMKSAHNSLDFCQTMNGRVHCCDTVQADFFTKIINIKADTESTNERKRSITNKEEQTQCKWYTENSTTGTILCCCGLPKLQERNARTTIERGSQVIEVLTQFRIVEQEDRHGHGHGSSPSQVRDHCRRCVRKGVTDPEKPSGAKSYHDGCADRWDKDAKYKQQMSEQEHSLTEMEHWTP